MRENIEKKIASLIDSWGFGFDFAYSIGLNKTDNDKIAVKVELPTIGIEDCWWGIEQCRNNSQMIVLSNAECVPWEIMELANMFRIANAEGYLDFVWNYTNSTDGCGKKVLMN